MSDGGHDNFSPDNKLKKTKQNKNCRRVLLSVIIFLRKVAFVSLEQQQSGALPSHKHPIFSENRYKGPCIPGGNNMSPAPRLMLWQRIHS